MDPEIRFDSSDLTNSLCVYYPENVKSVNPEHPSVQLKEKIEEVIESWFNAFENQPTSEERGALRLTTFELIPDLLRLENSDKCQRHKYAKFLSEQILANFHKQPESAYETLVKGIFNSKFEENDPYWKNAETLNFLLNMLLKISCERQDGYSYIKGNNPHPRGFSLYNQFLTSHLSDQYQQEMSSIKNTEDTPFPEDIWNGIISYLDWKGIRLIRSASKYMHKAADEVLPKKISNTILLELKRNHEKLILDILQDCPKKLQIMDKSAILEEFARRLNAKEITFLELNDGTQGYGNRWKTVQYCTNFLGDKCAMLKCMVFHHGNINMMDLDQLNEIRKFTNLTELSFMPHEMLEIPKDTEKFPLITSLHLRKVHCPILLGSLLNLFPNITELTCTRVTPNVFAYLENHTSLRKLTLLDRCMFEDKHDKVVSLPITHLSVNDSCFNTDYLHFPNLTHVDLDNPRTGYPIKFCLDFLINSPKLDSFSIISLTPIDLTHLKFHKFLKNLTIKERLISKSICGNITKWLPGKQDALISLLDFISLETLTIENFKIDEDLSILKKHKSLKILHLKNCTIDSETVNALEQKVRVIIN